MKTMPIAKLPMWPDVITAAVLRWFNDLADQGVLITDCDLRIVGWNRWLEDRTKRRAESVLGRGVMDMYPDLAARGLDQLYADALRGEARVVSHRFHRYLLPIPVEGRRGVWLPQSARIAPLSDGDTVLGTITLIQDVSERVATEMDYRDKIAALETAREAAELALRVKDEFLATLSHEMRTPLNAVIGWARTLRGHEDDRAIVTKALAVIERNAAAQAVLLEDLLDAARIASGKMRLDLAPVDLVPVLTAAIDVIRPSAAAKSLTIQTDLNPAVRRVQGDSARLQQVVWNILSNAVKFTEPGGTIDIALRQEGVWALVTIQDNGQGIAPEFLPHVFDRFRQADGSTSRRHGGLGLGLAVVRQLVELHGGTITVHSDGSATGTRVLLKLPVHPASAAVSVQDGCDSRDSDAPPCN